MKNLVIAFFCLLALSSCQKEFSLADGSNNSNNNGGNGTGTPPSGGSDGTYLLYGYNVNEHNDSTYAYYTYDAENRVKEYGYKGKDDSLFYNQTMKMTRDAEGKIISIDKEMDLGAMMGGQSFASIGLSMDSVIKTNMTVHYPAGSKNYDFTVETIDLFGMIVSTTIKYEYINNKVSKRTNYTSMEAFGMVVQKDQISGRLEYDYSASGNIATVRIYGPDSTNQAGPLKLMTTRTCTYNDKKNYVPANNEGFLYDQEMNSNANLVVTQSLYDNYHGTQGYDFKLSDIAYNSQGLIQAANMSVVSYNQGSAPTVKKYKSTYYYK